MSARRRLAAAALLAALAACAGGDAPPADSATAGAAPDSVASTPAPALPAADTGAPAGAFAGTLEPTRRERPVTIDATVLTDVRTARQAGYERVVFELRGDRMPGYDVLYESGPARQCGSGEPVDVAGTARLLVRLRGTHAHEFAGERAVVTVAERDRRLDFPLLRQLTLVCDFEAQVEWVLGLAERRPYRVLELRDPTRLVVDIESPGAP